ncbi:hypothetical protein [Flavobacterium psychrophilum]|uniref:hypothetical protein n=1 Tax=Flavobacterium psychrophilum TaxID=96345 RepID=UPI000B7C44CF|nr:hypothetical protein [Flavobacterium psychrophilum]MBF2024337.1 hypothetical protein [Flavobacterium psychrophilum]MCB5983211.1 hypothetical protein [Flavobacterium psychrophilum]MCB5995457.1 hypothetical protein [Flavobacterium psychrophilum]MCB5997795.1 hypothetical protein [Flavobacterium psychrophilum]MCB6005326.1 hypothetical protein [Flavobacterium psychrophilum]
MTKIERVRKLCKWLIYEGFADNDTELAKKLGYTKSSFSQIINEKVPLSDKFIAKLSESNKNINKFWILGRGDMLNTNVAVSVIQEDAGKIAMLERENAMQAKVIAGLERENQLLREARETNQDKSKPSHTVATSVGSKL